MRISRYLSLSLVALAALVTSCSKSDVFKVSGSIHDAKDKTVYLVRQGVDSLIVCDSAKLTADGRFSLEGRRPLCPDLYTLRVDSFYLWLAIDSTECIEVDADAKFKKNTVKGSEQCEQLFKWQQYVTDLNEKIAKNIASVGTIGRSKVDSVVFGLVSAYKDTASAYIQHNSESLVSQYLLFSPIALGFQPFNPLDKKDFHSFAIVANVWNKRYPGSTRAEHLKAMMDEMHHVHAAETFQKATEGTTQAGFIDLSFPDASGNKVSLSSLKGKNILLEFCYLAQMGEDADKVLKQTYEKYKQKGFEIYMVTFDKNYEVWQKKAVTYPWVVVLDANEISAATYNFKAVPTNYFIDKSGNIVGRDVTLAEMESYLKKH